MVASASQQGGGRHADVTSAASRGPRDLPSGSCLTSCAPCAPGLWAKPSSPDAPSHLPPRPPSATHAGLNLLQEMLAMFAQSDFATQFYQSYYLQLLREIFAVMTGGLAEGGWLVSAALQLAPAPRPFSLW